MPSTFELTIFSVVMSGIGALLALGIYFRFFARKEITYPSVPKRQQLTLVRHLCRRIHALLPDLADEGNSAGIARAQALLQFLEAREANLLHVDSLVARLLLLLNRPLERMGFGIIETVKSSPTNICESEFEDWIQENDPTLAPILTAIKELEETCIRTYYPA